MTLTVADAKPNAQERYVEAMDAEEAAVHAHQGIALAAAHAKDTVMVGAVLVTAAFLLLVLVLLMIHAVAALQATNVREEAAFQVSVRQAAQEKRVVRVMAVVGCARLVHAPQAGHAAAAELPAYVVAACLAVLVSLVVRVMAAAECVRQQAHAPQVTVALEVPAYARTQEQTWKCVERPVAPLLTITAVTRGSAQAAVPAAQP